MDRREALRTIAAEARRGELTFPTSVEVALRVQRSLDDPDLALDVAARQVQTEPLLSTRVVAVANSVAFNRSGRAITDVRLAVTRLGMRMVRALATAVITRQLAGKPAVSAHRGLADKLWEHSTNVAALANVIARRLTHQDPETAMFAGMVHEVGGFYLLSRAREFPSLMGSEPTDWVIEGEGEGEVEIGRAVLNALGVPNPVVAAIEALWQGYLAFPASTLGDTLLLAEHLASVKSPLHRAVQNSARKDGVAATIDMSIEEETLASILQESADEIRSLTSALQF